MFRDIDVLREIVGQDKSSFDFPTIMSDAKILLLRLPANMTGDVRNAIGTMVLSELLYAVFEQAEQKQEQRPFFGVYCDEFQHFATPDFARLFTETGKFNVMPVVAHQTREQFKPEDPNRGATGQSPNKVFFALSPVDASEMALEFAREPPTETRFHEQYVISQNPVRDLLDGHFNLEIRAFVNKYLRRLENKRDDIKEDMEGEKFARMIDLDTAGFYGADAQEEGIAGPSHYANQAGFVVARQGSILSARMHAIRLAGLHKEVNRLRVTMRGLNRFLTEVVEGDKRAEQEAFSDFLISLAAGYSALPEAFAETLGLYIQLAYGDPSRARIIPFELAKSHGLFSQEVAALTRSAEKKTEEERRTFQISYMSEEEQERTRWRLREREQKIWDRQSYGRTDIIDAPV